MVSPSSTTNLLTHPVEGADHPDCTRSGSSYNPLHRFVLPHGVDRHYQQQYADTYFIRLASLKKEVEREAAEHWANFKLGNETPTKVDRVLDVRQGELCWVVGTVFVESGLKPNVLDDLSKEHWIAAPPAREKYISPLSDGFERMLEDESGRLRIVTPLESSMLATGCIVAALGHENADGVFEVIETRVADLPRQPRRWERDEFALAVEGKRVRPARPKAGKVAFVSGLSLGGQMDDYALPEMLLEYLLGQSNDPFMQVSSAQISRLIVAGNSLADSSPIAPREEAEIRKDPSTPGADPHAHNSISAEDLDIFLAALLPTLPVTLVPGATDPANVAIPQQPLHPALFPHSRAYATLPLSQSGDSSWFDSVTNPWEGDIDGWRFLGTGGQPIEDLSKYVTDNNRLRMMESVLRWRCNAPTAPDTLWCYPFQDSDPLLIEECPHVYFAGNQPRFGSKVITGPHEQRVLLLAVPAFRESGQLVLLDMETLEPEVIQFRTFKRPKHDDMGLSQV